MMDEIKDDTKQC